MFRRPYIYVYIYMYIYILLPNRGLICRQTGKTKWQMTETTNHTNFQYCCSNTATYKPIYSTYRILIAISLCLLINIIHIFLEHSSNTVSTSIRYTLHRATLSLNWNSHHTKPICYGLLNAGNVRRLINCLGGKGMATLTCIRGCIYITNHM